MVRAYWACLAVLFPVCVVAQEAAELVPRDSCDALYTVQKRACVVETVWRCETGGGVFFANETIYANAVDTRIYTEDYEQIAPLTKKWKRKARKKDGFALSDLLTDGQDKLLEGGELDILGDGLVMPVQAEGAMRLTGEDVVLSGITLTRAEAKTVGRVGPLKYLKTADIYIDRDTGTMFTGAFSHGVPPNLVSVEAHPVEVIRPGEDGFMAEAAIHECEASG